MSKGTGSRFFSPPHLAARLRHRRRVLPTLASTCNSFANERIAIWGSNEDAAEPVKHEAGHTVLTCPAEGAVDRTASPLRCPANRC